MPCPYCGVPMSGRRLRNCGAAECRRQWDRDRVRAFLQRHAATGIRYEDRYKVERICECGAVFRTRHGAKRCPSCARRDQQRRAADASAEAKRRRTALRKQLVPAGPIRRAETLRYQLAAARLATAAAGTRSRNAVYVGATCHRCSASFVCLWTNDLPRWCSRSCARAGAKAVRRGRRRGGQSVRYFRRAIFERDGWTCQLCGKRVKRQARVPDPKAPVIDHIVPLAAGPELGGVDAPWNVQCAHFLCNSIKSANFAQPALALEVA